MLDFLLTDTERKTRDEAMAFARDEVLPIAESCDRAGETPRDLSIAAIRRWMPYFMDGDASSAYLVGGVVLAEEMSYACAGIASTITLPIFLNRTAHRYLAEDRKVSFAQELEADPFLTAFAASEEAAGSDLRSLTTRAFPDGSDYVITGSKAYSSNVRSARYVIVVARTADGDAREMDGFSWFLVPTDAPGVSIGPRWETLGLRAMDLSPVELDQVRVPQSHLLGEEGRGLHLMYQNLAASRTGIAAVGVAIARRARDEILAYGSKRKVGGERLTRMQDYRLRLAEMERDISAAKALVWFAAARHDRGLSHVKEASMAKLTAGEIAMSVTVDAALMMGSSGYTRAQPVEKLLRDARYVGIVEGPDPVQKELIFADMLRKGRA